MALAFATSSDVFEVGTPSGLNDLDEFTFWCWAKLDTAPGAARNLLTKGDRKRFQYLDDGSNNLRLVVERAGAAANARAVADVLTLSAWHFIAGTYDESDGPRLFVGDLETEISEVSYAARATGSGATQTDSTLSLLIGNSDGGNFWAGSIGFFGIETVRLTASQLARLQFSPHAGPDCVAFYDLSYTSSTIPDLSGNDHGGTTPGIVALVDGPAIGAIYGYDEPYLRSAVAGAGQRRGAPFFF